MKMEFVFIIMGSMSTQAYAPQMESTSASTSASTTVSTAVPQTPSAKRCPEGASLCGGRAMTRCECAGVSFEEIARRVATDGLSLEEIARRTGCGGTCTACIPDLRQFLSRR